MGDITKNFSRAEFACKCGCGMDNISPLLVEYLQMIRDHFDAQITVNSGLRCPAYNKRVGGAKASQHMLGKAADITVKGVKPRKVAEYADVIMDKWGGVKAYPTFTHVDVRSGYWRD